MIQENVIDLIRQNKTCKAELQIALDKGAVSIQKYLDDNNILLTTAAALAVIRKHTGLTDAEILDMETAAA